MSLTDPNQAQPIQLHYPPVEQARAALEAHKAHRPEPGTPEFSAWCDQKSRLQSQLELSENTARNSWSKPFVIPEKLASPSDPSPVENPVTPPPVSPEPATQLKSLLAHLATATREAETALTEQVYKSALGRIYQRRSQIKRLEAEAGLTAPELPAIPVNPWKQVPAVPKPAVTAPVPSSAPVETLHAPMEANARQSIASIRRSIWLLMADLEQMQPDGRGSLAEDLDLLDAAAHAAACLAAGKLQIA